MEPDLCQYKDTHTNTLSHSASRFYNSRLNDTPFVRLGKRERAAEAHVRGAALDLRAECGVGLDGLHRLRCARKLCRLRWMRTMHAA